LHNHISQRGWRRWNAKRKISADYDEFWVESNGTARRDGDFDLPVVPVFRNAEDVKSKKRKEWTLRHARLDDLRAQILIALGSAAEKTEARA
jgi:uncharacterized protein VirK/YbjX